MIEFKGLANQFADFIEKIETVTEEEKKKNLDAVWVAVNDNIFAPSKIDCPVDTSSLIESAYFTVEHRANVVEYEVGYTMPYAAYVHEMPQDTNWTNPRSKTKFLERHVNAFRERQSELIAKAKRNL
jgi:RNAse (barnase) inhibitor barstar